MEKNPVLRLEDVKVWFPIYKGFPKRVVGHVKAVDGITVDIYPGETLGVVGESGCGKSTLGRSMMLLEKPTGGRVMLNIGGEYKDITKLSKQETLKFRKNMQMVFQDPYSALNPLKNIYTAMEEPLIVQGIHSKKKREQIIEETLQRVNVSTESLTKYPNEFSGGQRQRICIARALEINPSVVVCDEAVSALDVSIQAQVLNLLKDIQKERNLTYIFIAHDLSVVEYMSDRIMVMYLGKVVEIADARTLYANPMHPYTECLLSAVPVPKVGGKKERIVLQGDVPSPINLPSGCPFHERCTECMDICRRETPRLKDCGDTHLVACHLHG